MTRMNRFAKHRLPAFYRAIASVYIRVVISTAGVDARDGMAIWLHHACAEPQFPRYCMRGELRGVRRRGIMSKGEVFALQIDLVPRKVFVDSTCIDAKSNMP